jgi:hypothetical protein
LTFLSHDRDASDRTVRLTISNYTDPGSPTNISKWAMEDFGGETIDPYPTTFGLFNTGGSGTGCC